MAAYYNEFDPYAAQWLRNLIAAGLIAPGDVANVYRLTETGCEIYNRLVTARREHLAEMWPEWSPKKREEVYEILRRLARELVPEAEAA